jgi:hypothetical protein
LDPVFKTLDSRFRGNDREQASVTRMENAGTTGNTAMTTVDERKRRDGEENEETDIARLP